MDIRDKPRTQAGFPEKSPRYVEGSIVSSTIISTVPAAKPVAAKKRPPVWSYPLILGLVLLLARMLWLVWAQGVPQVTIIIHPAYVERSGSIRLTATIAPATANQSQARLLISTRTSAQVHVQATGIVQKSATEARGELTFYNPESFPQTVVADTTFPLSQGFRIVTEQAVTIPPGTLSRTGSASVPAHILPAGAQGNIAASTLNGLCSECHGVSIAVQNTQPFSGGQDAQNYTIVSQVDLDSVARGQGPGQVSQAVAWLRGQVRKGEQLGTPIHCASRTVSDTPVGAKATQISIEVTSTCSAVAYNPQSVCQKAARLFGDEVAHSLDLHQVLAAPITAHILTPIVATSPGALSLLVQVSGRWVYRLNDSEQTRLIRQLAGEPREQALAELRHLPGIQEASIQGVQGNDVLPRDPGQLSVQIVSQQ